MQQLSANEIQQVSGGTLCALSLGLNVVSTSVQTVASVFEKIPLVGTLTQGISGATKAISTLGSTITGAIGNIPSIAANEFGKLGGGASGSASCGCKSHPTDPNPPTSPI